MAQPKILFYKGASAPATSTHGIGTLWFDKTNRVLKVRVGVDGLASDWEQYAGKIDDIQLTNQILTIKKADGTTYQIDLGDVASAGAVKDALDALDAKISANDTAIKANAAAITDEETRAKAEEARIEGKVNDNTTAIGAEETRATQAESALDAKIGAETSAREAADTAMQSDIDTLKNQITGLSGTLHFREDLSGAGKPAPTTSTEGAVGDFMVAGDGSEYICVKVEDSTYTWEKIGDTSAESAAISALQGRMDTAEDDINAVEGRMTTAEGKISTLEQGFAGLEDRFYTESEVDGKVANLQGQITDNADDIADLQERAGNIESAANTLAGRVTANENAIKDKADKSALEAAVARVSANETAIGQLQTSTSNNAQAISAEETRAKGAEATLQGNINTVDGKVDDETERAEAAEAALGTRIDGVVSRVGTLETEMDAAEGRLDSLEAASATHATKTELKAEEDARKAADEALDARVAACESALTWSGFDE